MYCNTSSHKYRFYSGPLGGGRCGRDRLVVGFITTYAISAYHNLHCKFDYYSCRGVLDTTLCDKVCQ